MVLHLHRSERADVLVEGLGALLSVPLPDPFAQEIVAVPTRGVERWISQQLALQLGARTGHVDGVCAGVSFPSLWRLVSQAAGSGSEQTADAWSPERAVWPLLRVIDRARDEPWAALLWSYLEPRSSDPADGARGARRWATTRRLADLFSTYASVRPAMIESWATGRDVDAAGRPLSADRSWQAELWRRLAAEIGGPPPTRAGRERAAQLRVAPDVVDLPARLSVFGATRFAPDQLELLSALAAHRDVHLWLPHPSPSLWDELAAAPAGALRPRADDRSEELVEHPLLGYLGRDTRELQQVLAVTDPAALDTHHPVADRATAATLLERLQHDLAADRVPAPPARPVLDANDDSVAVHASHGPDRQVEVLREVLVGLLADDPSLEPRDIVVMCPDIETFAPLIAAAFGLDTTESQAEHPGHRLRVRLADRSLRQLNPLLAVVDRVLALAESRTTASALLDLVTSGPVAYQFGFGLDDQERLADLVAQSGVKWGLDADHRARFGMGGFGQNTWAAGLDRLLLGVSMDETADHFLGTALPLDDVDSSDVDLVGRLGECLSRIRLITDACSPPKPVSDWIALAKRALDLLTAVPAADTWQLTSAYAELSRLAPAAEPGAGKAETTLTLAEVRAMLSETFRGRASRANFRTGTLTMCTMLPMRSVPHRVICLLGVDDGVFPRRSRVDGDDIAAADPWIGDRDPRSEDRQLLLDAVLATREKLVIIYAGADPRTGAVLPPAVPIGALLDALDATAVAADGRLVRDVITRRHPLQPFDARNFTRDLGRADRPFSFDRGSLRGVRTAAQERRTAPAFSSGPLPRTPPHPAVELADLIRFFGHPVRALLRARAGLSFWRDDDGPDEQLAVELDGLERWPIGDRLLRRHLQGADLAGQRAAEWRRGTLPPRAFGAQTLEAIVAEVAGVADLAGPYLADEPQRYDVVAGVGSQQLVGLVPQVRGDVMLRVAYSKLSAKQRLSAWIELLGLTVAHPGRPWRAAVIGRGGRALLGPVDPGWATERLADLLRLQHHGLREALPFAPRTSAEYAIRAGRSQLDASMKFLERLWDQDRDEAYELFFGAVSLSELLRLPPGPEDRVGELAEPSRFGTLARRVFAPLLSAEDAS